MLREILCFLKICHKWEEYVPDVFPIIHTVLQDDAIEIYYERCVICGENRVRWYDYYGIEHIIL